MKMINDCKEFARAERENIKRRKKTFPSNTELTNLKCISHEK